MSDDNYRILTCDGGGIRGLITAMLLQKLDEELQQEGISLFSDIDLFAGTSTGGLIALGLASGVPISKLVTIYNSGGNCSQIFTPYNPNSQSKSADGELSEEEAEKLLAPLKQSTDELDNLENKSGSSILKHLEKVLYVKYNNTGLKTVIEQNIPSSSKSLAELPYKVLVTTFQLYNQSDSTNSSWRPITLDNLPNNHIRSENTKLLDAALCTSAAPVYFPPYHHPDYGYCIDGGVFANNPSTLALARVINSGILEDRDIRNIRMLSIGTGQTHNNLPPSYQPDGPLRFGVTTWLWPFSEDQTPQTPKLPLLSILMDSSSIVDGFQAKMILGEDKYQRINLQLTESIAMDGCPQISLMETLVNEYIQSPEWNEEKTWVKNYFID
ncbi:patatin-like phospholipase family protein [Cylindrospermum sp. FACHB-282]|uniref:patatin-like phospholipase family protein n=1 Tax=Cylindrospermum sp. FACHB-282 TaxID=2692794 RepID=UPI001682FD64|nr:patatin-like phospholipase family protein [Cylindrospermum sp. FACHB-282]MBD2386438.1 patatin-like phospholipase family protein [Cylindrospermum sp. FACHB-282]